MANKYSPQQQRAALLRLETEPNLTQVQLCREMGISTATLRNWRKKHSSPPSPPENTALEEMSSPEMIGLLRERLIKSAVSLANSLDEVIEVAPLNQRATALSQLIDKIIKLAEQLPIEHEQVIRIEYLHPDGSIRQRPPWTEEDSTE